MRKLLLIPLLLCLCMVKAVALEYTDANGVTWTFEQRNWTINGEEQRLWTITGVKNYPEDVVIPEKMITNSNYWDYNLQQNVEAGTEVTIEAINGSDYNDYQIFGFNSTGKVSSITVPKSIKFIGYGSLTAYGATVIINRETPPVIGMYDNKYTSFYNCTVKVPASLLNTYREAEGWVKSQYTIISQDAKTDYEVTVSAQGGLSTLHQAIGEENLGNVMSLKVTGTINSYDLMVIRNKMFNIHHLDLSDASILANPYKYYGDYYVEEDNTTGRYAFGGINRLSSIKLPKTLKTISISAFYNCKGLQTVEFQEGLENIYAEAFYECSNLKEISLKKGLVAIYQKAFSGCGMKSVTIEECDSIGSYVFENCYPMETFSWKSGRILGVSAFRCDSHGYSKLYKVSLPSNLKIIGASAFYMCSALVDITLPDGLEMLTGSYSTRSESVNGKKVNITRWRDDGGYTFNECSSLKGITIPDGVTRIGEYVFQNCKSLETVNLSRNLTEISKYAFSNCTSLTSISMPTTLRTISEYAFQYCSALPKIELPSSLVSIGNYAFTGCTALNGIYTYTLQPTDINQQTFSSWRTATLWVQHLGYYNYWYDTQWSQFAAVKEFGADYKFDYFYINKDYTFNDQMGVINGTPDADLNAGSGLIVENTNATVELDEVHMAKGSSASGSIIANNNLSVNTLFFDIAITKNTWQFITFPFRVKLTNVTAPGSHVFRYYDGEERAKNGSGGWKNVAGDYLEPGTGYIFHCNEDGTLKIQVDKEDLDFTATRQTTMATYAAEDEQNASWNFMGNPQPCYFDLNKTDFTAPITIWNGKSYDAVRPGDDNYFLSPFQAFFVQKPEGIASILFPSDGRYTYQQMLDAQNKQNNASARVRTSASQRNLINLAISDGENKDMTRVVMNSLKSTRYEKDCDAAKFISTEAVPQIYSIDDDGTLYAINERPEGEVRLGYIAAEKGMLTISATRMDQNVVLRDLQLGIDHNLSEGDYTFSTEAGTNDTRFVLIPKAGGSSTAISDATEDTENAPAEIFSLDGRRVNSESGNAGIYVIKKGNKVTKHIVK